MPVPRVLSIAGTDPTGGAGVQADLKSIGANGGYGMAVVTALVAQNTQGVRSVHAPPAEFLAEQLRSVSDDVEIDAVKIGMLFDADLIAVVEAWLSEIEPPVVVLDPVMVATSGDRLLDVEAEHALQGLLHRVDLITPNLAELAVLAGAARAHDWPEALRQAQAVALEHDVRVLAKGGHLSGPDAPDALVEPVGDDHPDGVRVTDFPGIRIETGNTHGTGCSLSSAVATLMAGSGDWETSIRQAKAWLTESIAAGADLHVGHGHGPINHFAGLWRTAAINLGQ